MRISEAYHPLHDVAIVRGSYIDDYPTAPPGPEDLALLVEVSDTTQAIDRGAKLRAYAAAKVPVYWVLDTRARRLDIHTGPSGSADEPPYADVQSLGPEEQIKVSAAGTRIGTLAVRDLLPSEGR
ncbi:MAG: Uma2 family endonuclease [Isosphaeraceae bacterium]|nr:Uma2 family endonuclease [Isosphaeraceae bacterium]